MSSFCVPNDSIIAAAIEVAAKNKAFIFLPHAIDKDIVVDRILDLGLEDDILGVKYYWDYYWDKFWGKYCDVDNSSFVYVRPDLITAEGMDKGKGNSNHFILSE